MVPLVTSSETTWPTTTADAWDIKAAKALITIIANYEEEPQSFIEVCATLVEAWDILKKHYERWTQMHLSALLLNITALWFDDRKTTITNHITIFEGK